MPVLKRHDPSSLWRVPDPFQTIYSHGVEVPSRARLLMISGQVGIDPEGKAADAFIPQCKQAMANVEAMLVAAGMQTSDLVKVTYYLTRPADLADLTMVRQQRWASISPPAVTTLVVSALARPEFLIEIEAMAATTDTYSGGD